MTESMEKFLEVVKSDEVVQKKLQAAVDSYNGEQTEEAAFTSIIAPLAEEYGFKISYDEYQQAKEQSIKDLNIDEMDQIAGGTDTEGDGSGVDDYNPSVNGFGIGKRRVCLFLGTPF